MVFMTLHLKFKTQYLQLGPTWPLPFDEYTALTALVERLATHVGNAVTDALFFSHGNHRLQVP